jgi:hypothetical protein
MRVKTEVGTNNTTLIFVCQGEAGPQSSPDEPLYTLSRLVRDWLAPELARRLLASRHATLGPNSQSHFKKMNYETPPQKRLGDPSASPEEVQ